MLWWLFAFMLIHEAGHALVSQASGNPCRQLRIGIGPRLAAWSWHGFRFVLSALPFGFTVGMERRRFGVEGLTAAGGLSSGLALALSALWFAGLTNDAAAGVAGLLCLVLTGVNLLPVPGLDGYFLFGLAPRLCYDVGGSSTLYNPGDPMSFIIAHPWTFALAVFVAGFVLFFVAPMWQGVSAVSWRISISAVCAAILALLVTQLVIDAPEHRRK